jgi:hypothetical protein
MKLRDFSLGFVHGVGTFVGRTCKVLSWPGNALSNAMEKLRSVFPSARIQAIVTKELMHLMSTEGLAEEKLEQRFKVMAETILALQERLDEMVTGGHISETDMLKAMDSLIAAESLTYDERAILVTVFRQNIAIQKPDLIDTAVV